MKKRILSLKGLAYAAVLAAPLYLVKVSFFGLPTNIFELLALATFGLFLNGVVGLENKLRDYKEYFIPIVMLICGLFLSMACSESYRNGLGIIKGWFVVPIIFSWVCAQVIEDKKNILKAVYASAFLVACFSAGYFLTGRLTFDGRLQAFYNSPNFLAMCLAPAIIIGTFLFKENRRFYLGSLAVIIFSFYQTRSYAAWLAVFIAISTLIIIRNKKNTVEWKKLIITVFIIGAMFLSQRNTDKMNSFIELGKERSSTSSRLMIWHSAIKIGFDNPIAGIGPGNFQNKYLEYQKYFPPYLEWAVPQPHSLFLALWLQAGLLGCIGFFWVIIVWLKELIGRKEWNQEDYVFLGIMVYMLLHGLVDTTYFKNDLAVLFWLIVFSAKKHSLLKKSA